MAGVYKGLTIRLDADSTGLSRALNDIDRQTRGLKREMSAVNKALKLDPKNTDLARQKMEVYQKEVQAASERLKTLREAESQIGKDGMSSDAWNTLQRDIAATEGELGRITGEYRAFTVEQAAATSGLGKAGAALTELGGKLEPAAAALESAGARASAAITAPAVAAGAASVKIAMGFETSLAKVSTLVDETKTSMDELGDGARELAVDYGRSASEINEAMYQALSASVDQEKVLGFVEEATRLSKAGFTESATAVDVLTTAINAYGMKAEDAAHISDVLVNTQNLGKTTVNELAASMGNVIPTAAAYGVNLENLASSYALMTKQGINTANATTAINGMLTELADNGSDVNGVLQDMTGKTFAQIMRDGSSLGDVMSMLNEHVDGDSEAFANLWGNVRASKGALSLANAGAEEFNATLGSMTDASGTVDSALEKLGGTAQGSIAKAKAEVEDAAITVGQVLLPYVSEAAGAVKGAAEAFDSMSDGEKEAAVRAAALAAGLGPALLLLSKAMGLVGSLGGGMTKLAKTLASLDLATNGTARGFTAAAKAGENLSGKAMAASVAMGGAKAALVALSAAAVATFCVAVKNSVDEANRFRNATDGLHSSVYNLGRHGSGFDLAAASSESYAKSLSEATRAQSDLVDEIRGSFESVGSDAGKLEFYNEKIQELAGHCDGDARKMAELQAAVEGYNSIAGTSISVIDGQTGALNTSTFEIDRNAEAWRNNALAQAAAEAAQKVAAQMIEDEMALERAETELADAKRYVSEQEAAGLVVDKAYLDAIEAKQREVEKLTALHDASAEEYDRLIGKEQEYRSESERLSDAVGGFRDALAEAGRDTGELDQAADSLGMSVDDLVSSLREAGVDAGEFASVGRDEFLRLANAANGDFSRIAEAVDLLNETGLEPKHIEVTDDGTIKVRSDSLSELDRQNLAKKGFEVTDDGTIKRVSDSLKALDDQQASPKVEVNDQASGIIDRIKAKLGSLAGASANVKVGASGKFASGALFAHPLRRVPAHADGGITGVVTRAVMTDAGLVGEDGAEYMHDFAGGSAIVPIQNSRYVRPLARELAREMPSSAASQVVNRNVYIDGIEVAPESELYSLLMKVGDKAVEESRRKRVR